MARGPTDATPEPGRMALDIDDAPYASVRAAPADRAFVVAQLGQSLDGRIATPTGESRWINQSSALDHVHRLRATVDGVVVGAREITARATDSAR